MKLIAFRPLRHVKKTGKVVVAAYSQWNRVRAADYAVFALAVAKEYALLPPDEQVYNHEGKPLCWHDFDPDTIPVWERTTLTSQKEFSSWCLQNLGFYAVRWQPFQGFPTGNISYACRLLDCSGTPTFSHQSIDYVADYYADFAE